MTDQSTRGWSRTGACNHSDSGRLQAGGEMSKWACELIRITAVESAATSLLKTGASVQGYFRIKWKRWHPCQQRNQRHELIKKKFVACHVIAVLPHSLALVINDVGICHWCLVRVVQVKTLFLLIHITLPLHNKHLNVIFLFAFVRSQRKKSSLDVARIKHVR